MTNLVSLITPTNLLSEKAKFLASSTYNPVFHYGWENLDLNPDFEVKLKYPLWDAIKLQDQKAIVSAAQKLFEVKIDEFTLTQSKRDAAHKGKSSNGSAEEFAKLIVEGLRQFSIYYAVEISDESGFNARPQHNLEKLIISKDAHFDYFSMEGGVRHDLVHIIRHLNSRYNKIKNSQNYLPTEEGLASWCQDNTNDDNGLAQHAMEYIASSVGVTGSLRDIYDCLRELGMSSELAWKRGSRHKFGFIDTSLPGDILKPAMYYQNELLVGSLSSDEKLRLFVGKINASELPAHPSYSGRWPPNLLTDYFHL